MTSIRTRLYINDKTASDTIKDLKTGAPTALEGLQVSYGRRNSIDDVDAGTLHAVLLATDQSKAREFLEALTPNSQLRVVAEYELEAERAPYQTPYLFSSHLEITGTTITAKQHNGNVFIAPVPFDQTGKNNTAWIDTNPALKDGTPIRVALRATASMFLGEGLRAWLMSLPSPNATVYAGSRLLDVQRVGNTFNIGLDKTYKLKGDGHPAIVIEVPSATFNDAGATRFNEAPIAWQNAGKLTIEPRLVLAPAGDPVAVKTLFSGRLSSWKAEHTPTGTRIYLTGTDILGALSALMIGAPPRPRESVEDRIRWALEQSGMPIGLSSNATRNPLLESIDIDNRSALDVIRQAARSAALTAWATARPDGRDMLLLDDLDSHDAQARLSMVEGKPSITANSRTTIGASLIPQSGVEIERQSEEAITQAVITWIKRTWNEDYEPQDETITEYTGIPSGATLKVDTQLMDAETAISTGNAFLRRLPASSWMFSGAKIDTSRIADLRSISQIIDIVSRPSLPVTVSGMPAWIPAAASSERFTLEGAQFTQHNDAYEIELSLSRPRRIGRSMTWNEAPSDLTFDSADFLTFAHFTGLIPA